MIVYSKFLDLTAVNASRDTLNNSNLPDSIYKRDTMNLLNVGDKSLT